MSLSKQIMATEQQHNLLGPVEEVQMGIKASALGKIISRLTDLYTNPIEATVREVVSNAIDATMLLPAEDRQPIQITTPGQLLSVFTVRDFGAGMSPEDVRNVYSQYGGSTKEDDFNAIGSYGLGAKAPLSYCSSFTVITIKDNVRTELVVARRADGNFVEINSIEATDEPSGTMIAVPTASCDEDKFRTIVSNYSDYSLDIPVVINGKIANSDRFVQTLEIVIEKESGTIGRVFVNAANIKCAIEGIFNCRARNSKILFTPVLSGWKYKIPNDHNWYRADNIIVELKPGVVDFSSSRDTITSNKRWEDFSDCVNEALKAPSNIINLFKLANSKLSYEASFALLQALDIQCPTEDTFVIQDVTFASSDATLDTGENVISDSYKKRPQTIPVMGAYFRISGRKMESLGLATVRKTGVKPGIYPINYRLLEVNQHIVEDVSEDYLSNSYTSLHQVAVFTLTLQANTKAFIVTGINCDNVKRILSLRRSVLEPLADGPFVLMFAPDSVHKEYKALSDNLKARITILSAESIIDTAKAHAKARPSKIANKALRCIHIPCCETFSSLIAQASNARVQIVNNTFEPNSFIILANDKMPWGLTSQFVKAASEAGHDLLNRHIYLVTSKLNTGDYKAICENYDYISTRYVPNNTKMTQKLYAEALAPLLYTSSEIDDIPDESLLFVYASVYTSNKHGRDITRWWTPRVEANVSELKLSNDNIDNFKAIAKSLTLRASERYIKADEVIENENFLSRLKNQVSLCYLNAFLDILSNQNHNNAAASYLSSVLNLAVIEDLDEVQTFIIKSAYETLTNAINMLAKKNELA